jgi:hypothetical protein
MLAIHHQSGSFSDKWIDYCCLNKVPYKLVDCYCSNIVEQMQECDGLMWHWLHYDYKAALFARQLIGSLEKMGKMVFPNLDTCWHYDDKVGQKYLLEAIGAPLVASHVFYEKEQALDWARNTDYPKVFKLRGGAGAENVRLVRNKREAIMLIDKAFACGFKMKKRLNFLTERLWAFRRDKTLISFLNITKGIARQFVPTEEERNFPHQRNYIYFQDFIPDNSFDIRVFVIGSRAFAIKRIVRDGDFRASGSGNFVCNPDDIPVECLRIAFDIASQLQVQSVAYDFVFYEEVPLIIEISYAFNSSSIHRGPRYGYWDKDLNRIECEFFPEFFIIEDFLEGFYAL